MNKTAAFSYINVFKKLKSKKQFIIVIGDLSLLSRLSSLRTASVTFLTTDSGNLNEYFFITYHTTWLHNATYWFLFPQRIEILGFLTSSFIFAIYSRDVHFKARPHWYWQYLKQLNTFKQLNITHTNIHQRKRDTTIFSSAYYPLT